VKLVLVHLYPDLMNVYGDRGNIITLQRRAAWRGIELDVRGCTLGEQFDPHELDVDALLKALCERARCHEGEEHSNRSKRAHRTRQAYGLTADDYQ